uniref:DNA helicase n=1 Tax=Tanacetum cinerariifolium TaxID=118510 RepID=A0A6L2MCW2_TANCI|nr:DNA helicase [Tanacetum cinerariifolium]
MFHVCFKDRVFRVRETLLDLSASYVVCRSECDKGGAAVLQITRPNADIIDPYSLKTCDILGDRRGNRRYLHPVSTQYLPEESISAPKRILPEYNQLGQCTCVCRHCGAMFWECEKVASASHISRSEYNKCCYGGCIILRPPPEYPQYIKELYEDAHFIDNIRAYNQMFSMTSLEANIDKSINNGKWAICFQNIRLDYIRQKQDDIRSEYLSSIYDVILRGDRDGSDIGLRTVLTASFTGSSCYMYAYYLDALAICRVHGSPSFFITFTCNTKWPEIEEFMKPFPQLTVTDRADIVDRVFEKKVQDYIAFVRDSRTFGTVTGVPYTIEFQKRGLPHCHSLLWINSESKVQQDVDVDKYVCAELPDPVIDPHTYEIIFELMIHGLCGFANPTATCMKDGGTCNRNFPKPYCNKTYIDKEGFVHYLRRHTKIQVQRQCVLLDNRYVVPYNATLCLRYHAHINVEYCGWTMFIKYLFKYISKGTNRVIVNVTKSLPNDPSGSNTHAIQIDEIKNYVEARYIGPYEACWRILDFHIHYRNPHVQTLAVHLENMQQLKFRSKDSLQSIVSNPMKKNNAN